MADTYSAQPSKDIVKEELEKHKGTIGATKDLLREKKLELERLDHNMRENMAFKDSQECKEEGEAALVEIKEKYDSQIAKLNAKYAESKKIIIRDTNAQLAEIESNQKKDYLEQKAHFDSLKEKIQDLRKEVHTEEANKKETVELAAAYIDLVEAISLCIQDFPNRDTQSN